MKAYFDSALLYRNAGWLGVLPLPRGRKSNPPKGYSGGGRPHPTDEEIAHWRKSNPYGNVALRLADVDTAHVKQGRTTSNKLPVVYAGNTVDGWELLGIDVDNYAKAKGDSKRGLEELNALEEEYGPLPATALSSARWPEAKDQKQYNGCIAVYLVPKGFRFMGKAANCIDIVQKRHRYMVAWPSTNPEADDKQYTWRFGRPNYPAAKKRAIELRTYDPGSTDAQPVGTGADAPIGLPPLGDIAVLPEEWFNYLSRQGQVETEDPISALTDDDLWIWATTKLRYGDEPCKWMTEAVEKFVGELDASADSHPKLTSAHWRLFSLAAEGCAGLEWALKEYHSAWAKHVLENRGGAPEDLMDEISRSVMGALSKIEPVWAERARPDDPCEVRKQVEDGEWDERLASWDAKIESRVTEMDYGGLGPVVGKLLDSCRHETHCKPPDEYGRHDYGNGQHFVDLFGENVKYVGARKSWIIWDGERWHRDQDDRLIGRAFQAVRQRQEAHAIELAHSAAMDSEDKDAKAQAKTWSTWARRSGDTMPVKNALIAARSAYVGNEPVVILSLIHI